MSDSIISNFRADEGVGDRLKLTCKNCKRSTNHEILKSVSHGWSNEDYDIQGNDDYLTVQCRGCDRVSFCIRSTFSEDYDHRYNPETSSYEGYYPETLKQHPIINIEYPTLALPASTPSSVRKVYDETQQALDNNMSTLSAAGTRIVVEAICKDKKAKGRDLATKIDKMAANGIISADVAATIHAIRFLGNDAVHDTAVETRELSAAWQVINMLITYLYGNEDQRKVLLTSERLKKLATRVRNAAPPEDPTTTT